MSYTNSTSERILIVANRLPVTIHMDEKNYHFSQSPGGLASALSSLQNQYDLEWIGWPGEVDLSFVNKEELSEQLQSEYNATPIFLTRSHLYHYYFGFSNRALWPILHYLPSHMNYEERDYQVYKEVNKIFADYICEKLLNSDKTTYVWVHDYHLFLVPRMVRERIFDANIGFFLHTPFPSSEVFRALPYREELLEGILGANLVGFHTYSYLRHFRSSLLHILGLESEIDHIELEDHRIKFQAFPISIDTNRFKKVKEDSAFKEYLSVVKNIKKDRTMILSVDRLDYTKGIPERFRAFKKFLIKNSEYVDKVVFIQIAVPSRTRIPDYKHLKDRIEMSVLEINEEFEHLSYPPVHYINRSFPFEKLCAFYHEADIALVTPYFDGMNLVAKEFVAMKEKEGVLILSELAGAASELGEALIVNPRNPDQIAQSIREAMEMTREEQKKRMNAMFERIYKYNVHYWANSFLNALKEASREEIEFYTAPFTESVFKNVITHLKNAKNPILFLDYDGTLKEIVSIPLKAKPDQELKTLLKNLVSINLNLGIVTGRKKEEIIEWLGELPIYFSCEHGLWIRDPEGKWEKMLKHPIGKEWYKQVEEIFEEFSLKTPGSFVEKKEYSLAWHYRLTDPTFGKWQSRELIMHLKNILSNLPLDILHGKAVVEVRIAGINKGNIINYFKEKAISHDFILAAGDDETDENLFTALPEHAYSIKIGKGATHAKFRFNHVKEFRYLLHKIYEELSIQNTTVIV